MATERKEGIAYIWCPFCLKEWEEELPWDYITAQYFYVCSDCYEAGRTEQELTPEFWVKLMGLYEPQRTLDAWLPK